MSPPTKRQGTRPAAKKNTVKSKTATVCRPKITVPNPESIQQALDEIKTTINDPEYQEQLKKLTQLSVANSLLTVRKLSTLSERVSQLDSEGMDKLVSGSVSDMMRLSLQFNSEMLTLVQKMSNQMVDILDKATPEPQESACESTDE
jgi:hypothetical protein